MRGTATTAPSPTSTTASLCHQRDHTRPTRAERDPNRELTFALKDQIREQSVQADRREQQREQTERRRHRREQSFPHHDPVEFFRQRADLVLGHAVVGLPDRIANGGHDRAEGRPSRRT